VRRTLQDHVDALKQQARASPILHGDETTWRENGQHGYIWCFSTPGEDAVRYYEYDHSRGQAVVKRLLGGAFAGHLVSDFYCGYNIYAGKHQRCWVHLLRDLHALKEQQADDAVVQWAQDVRALYDDAQTWLYDHPQPSQEAREQQYVTLVTRAHALGLSYARMKHHPLCERRHPISQARQRKSLCRCVCALTWYHRRASAARYRESPVSDETV